MENEIPYARKREYTQRRFNALKGFKRNDEPSRPKLAIPVIVVQFLVYSAQFQDKKTKAIADLCLIAFYYLLRVGEYTYHKKSQRRRTKQFRVGDVKFWNNTHTLPPEYHSVLKLFQACTASTLGISNQKNGRRNQVIHQEAIHSDFCPSRALIRRVKHILAHTSDKNTMLGTVFINGVPQAIQASDITKAIR